MIAKLLYHSLRTITLKMIKPMNKLKKNEEAYRAKETHLFQERTTARKMSFVNALGDIHNIINNAIT